MAEFTLYVGNKTYSSWSLRGWLMMKQVGAPFDDVVIPMAGPGNVTRDIREKSPSGRVPLLKHGELLVWDSLAIGEYLAELFPAAKLWPEDRATRAVARSVSAEMHSGFTLLRSAMPMNVRRAPFTLKTAGEVHEEIARIVSVWGDVRKKHAAAGPYLFGAFTIADAMFAPVATRFRVYGVELDATARAYVDTIYAHPAMREWIAAATAEPWKIDGYERVGT